MEEIIKLIVTDDKENYRKLIRQILQPYAVEIVAEASNGKELLKLLRKKPADIVLLDLEMPIMDGNQAFERISREFPGTRVIILSYYYESVLMEDYLQRGAKGYIPKDRLDPELLIRALKEVKRGGVFVYEAPVDQKKFSSRQKEIMPLIFEGFTNEEIAETVCISKRSVEKQRHKIYEKSGAEKVIDFYKYAFSKGLQFLGHPKKAKNSALN
jgi:DNA-binding NarL/FixJ family response regulator